MSIKLTTPQQLVCCKECGCEDWNLIIDKESQVFPGGKYYTCDNCQRIEVFVEIQKDTPLKKISSDEVDKLYSRDDEEPYWNR